MVIYLSLAICILGGFLYLIFSHPPAPPAAPPWWQAPVAEMALIMFGVGLLVFLLLYKAHSTVSLFQ